MRICSNLKQGNIKNLSGKVLLKQLLMLALVIVFFLKMEKINHSSIAVEPEKKTLYADQKGLKLLKKLLRRQRICSKGDL